MHGEQINYCENICFYTLLRNITRSDIIKIGKMENKKIFTKTVLLIDRPKINNQDKKQSQQTVGKWTQVNRKKH